MNGKYEFSHIIPTQYYERSSKCGFLKAIDVWGGYEGEIGKAFLRNGEDNEKRNNRC